MMFTSAASRQGKKCTYAIVSDFGWGRFYSMRTKSEACETIMTLFVRDEIPSVSILSSFQRNDVKGRFLPKAERCSMLDETA